MFRTSTALNIQTRPGIGMAYIVKDLTTKKFVRASTCCQRDLSRPEFNLKTLRIFSGPEPFFMAKIGSVHTETQVLKFLCGSNHKKCLDETGTYQWLEVSLSEARKENLKFSEPGYLVKEEKVAKVTKPAKVAKPTKVTKTAKPTKVAKPAKAAKLVVAEIVPEVVPQELITEEVATNEDQLDAEFAAELDADHQLAVAKANLV